MSLDLERSPERDTAIEALLPLVPSQGWTLAALRQGAGPDADLLFPGGPAELVEAYSDLVDRHMQQAVADAALSDLRLPDRVRGAILIRLRQNRDHKDALRRGLALLTLPPHLPVAAKILARSVNAIWQAAEDRSADFSWYTKRAILASIYSATLLRWLNDSGPEDEATLAFLDRRLADVARIGSIRRRFHPHQPTRG
jgi:ubiquinone biosynthesis protein COQ9